MLFAYCFFSCQELDEKNNKKSGRLNDKCKAKAFLA